MPCWKRREKKSTEREDVMMDNKSVKNRLGLVARQSYPTYETRGSECLTPLVVVSYSAVEWVMVLV